MVNQVEPADRDIAMVFQNYALYPHMSVYNNMAYGLRNRGMPKPEIDTRVQEAARILELGAMLDRKPGQLSGGQRQRVAMGRAIVRQPKVFLFDEPLSNLDAKLRIAMRVEIRKLQRRLNTTSIYVTHDQLEAMTLADILVVMNGGQVEQIGNPLDIYQKPATTFVASFIGAPPMNLIALRDSDIKLADRERRRHPRNPPRGFSHVEWIGARRRHRHGPDGRSDRTGRRGDLYLRPAGARGRRARHQRQARRIAAGRNPGSDSRRRAGLRSGSESAPRRRAKSCICSAPTAASGSSFSPGFWKDHVQPRNLERAGVPSRSRLLTPLRPGSRGA